MKWIIILTGISFIMVIFIILKGLQDAEDFEEALEKSLTDTKEDEMFMENNYDEFSPEQLETDLILKRLHLRRKLNEIEEERKQDDVDFDYDRLDGR